MKAAKNVFAFMCKICSQINISTYENLPRSCICPGKQYYGK